MVHKLETYNGIYEELNKTSNIYFICSLFSNAFSVTQTIVSNEGMISDEVARTCKRAVVA
jgi:hypothetical protein